jgi:hypothetical protein
LEPPVRRTIYLRCKRTILISARYSGDITITGVVANILIVLIVFLILAVVIVIGGMVSGPFGGRKGKAGGLSDDRGESIDGPNDRSHVDGREKGCRERR